VAARYDYYSGFCKKVNKFVVIVLTYAIPAILAFFALFLITFLGFFEAVQLEFAQESLGLIRNRLGNE
jgi:hypothetical protein